MVWPLYNLNININWSYTSMKNVWFSQKNYRYQKAMRFGYIFILQSDIQSDDDLTHRISCKYINIWHRCVPSNAALIISMCFDAKYVKQFNHSLMTRATRSGDQKDFAVFWLHLHETFRIRSKWISSKNVQVEMESIANLYFRFCRKYIKF